MITFHDILEARAKGPERVHALAARRLLEAVGERPFAVVGDSATAWEELERRGHRAAFGLDVAFEAADGTRGEEAFTCLLDQTLRQAGRLGRKLGRPILYSGPETGGDLCVLPPEGGLVRCGPRSEVGLTRGYEALRGVAKVRFDGKPWGWIEAVMEDAWRRDRGG